MAHCTRCGRRDFAKDCPKCGAGEHVVAGSKKAPPKAKAAKGKRAKKAKK